MKRFLLIAVTALLFNFSRCAPVDVKTQAVANESLDEHLKDIADVLPKHLIRDIATQHLQTDEEFKAAIKYMQSKEWVDLVEAVRYKPEWVAFKKYVNDSGLDIDVIIHCMETFAENATITLEPKDPPPKRSFKSLFIDIEQQLPTVAILNILHEKMSKGPAFQQFFDRLSNEEAHKLLEGVFGLPEIQRMLNILAEMDVNLYDMFSLMYTFFGWGEFKKP